MNVENAVNHGVHSEHGEKRGLMRTCSMFLRAITRDGQELKLLAVPAVPQGDLLCCMFSVVSN